MFMKYFALLFLFIASSVFSQEVITYDQAPLYYNEYKTVCGKVSEIVTKNGNTFINFGGYYPNQKFVVYVTNNKYGNVYNFKGKNVCATGTINNYKGKPEIINPIDLKSID